MVFYYFSTIFFIFFLLLLIIFFLFIMKEELLVVELNIFNFQVIELKIFFFFDIFSLMFLLIISMISLAVFLFSKNYMVSEKNKIYFLILTFMFIMSMFILIMSLNMWMIMWGWDGLGIISYLLIVFYQSEISNYCGMITILTNRLGDVGMILSMFFLFNINSLDLFFINNKNLLMNFFFLMVIFGVMTKSAQFPFSSWLPLAMAAPTPISSLVHSSTLVTAGLYLLIRLGILKKNIMNFTLNLFIFSLLTTLMAGFCALSELDMKKIIALSTLSQLGFMFLMVYIGNELMSFYHILTHALFKSLLFLCSGVFIFEFLDNQDIRSFNFGLFVNNFVVSVFMVCNLSLMGVPFLSGYYSKDLILEFIYMLNMNMYFMMMIFLSMLLTSLYSFRMIYFSLLLSSKGSLLIFKKNWNLMYSCLLILFFGVITLGSVLNWFFLDKFEILILKFQIKLINLIYILIGFIMYSFINFNYMSVNMIYLYNLFFLTKFQGFMTNKIYNNFFFFTCFSEFYMLNYFILKISSLMYKFSLFFYMNKFIFFYMIFLIMFYFMFY